MKKVLNLTVLSMILIVSMSATPASKPIKKTSIMVTGNNGTAYTAKADMGAYILYLSPSTSGQYGPINSYSSYTITITCAAPGSHTYIFNGVTVVSSTGVAHFPQVAVENSATITVY